jgi:hypothetical protein
MVVSGGDVDRSVWFCSPVEAKLGVGDVPLVTESAADASCLSGFSEEVAGVTN